MNEPLHSQTIEDNLTCDICGYIYPFPDITGVVVKCSDGITRCSKCLNEETRRILAEMEDDDDDDDE